MSAALYCNILSYIFRYKNNYCNYKRNRRSCLELSIMFSRCLEHDMIDIIAISFTVFIHKLYVCIYRYLAWFYPGIIHFQYFTHSDCSFYKHQPSWPIHIRMLWQNVGLCVHKSTNTHTETYVRKWQWIYLSIFHWGLLDKLENDCNMSDVSLYTPS